MDTREALLIAMCMQVSCMSGIPCNDGAVSFLSREDVLLINDREDLKCFTRTTWDFTCFFETAGNETYDLLYSTDNLEGRCPMSVQRTQEGTFLNVYSFPEDTLPLFAIIALEAKERNTNITLFRRNVSVEDHIFLVPPFSVSLHENDQVGQLRVSWFTKPTSFCHNEMHRIRYSSKGLGERTKTEGKMIDSLVPGEMVQVQVSVKCESGYWSRWSHPVQHMGPQSADDVSLICFTPDLQNLTCQWNGSKYGDETGFDLFYKTSLSHTSSWTEWTKCPAQSSVCHFTGDVSRDVLVKLSERPAPLSKTFYTHRFTLNNSIKTPPPRHLTATLENDRLCLGWDAPLPSLSTHLQYEGGYQTRRGEPWMAFSPEGPKSESCLGVAAGTKYSVKVRAQPKGAAYSGHWSDWSEVVTVDTPAHIGIMPLLCVPLLVVIGAIICFATFSMYLSKIRAFFWPPVPNLDKVLQGFLAEINSQKWDLSAIAKTCPDETTSSVVEIMSQEDVSELGKQSRVSTQLLSPERPFSSKDSVGAIFPDYVTLSKDSTIICPKGNNYVYEQQGGSQPVVRDVLLQTCPTSCLCSEYLNYSYSPLSDTFTCTVTAARAPANPYANLPC